jgi:hypothetical protein
MTALALPHADLFGRFISVFWRRNHGRKHTPASNVSPEVAQARREFLREVLMRNPDGFSSELDLQDIMRFYSGRF